MPYADLEVRRTYHREYMRRYNTPETPEGRVALREQWRIWHHKNKERRNRGVRERNQAVRLEMLDAYGGRACVCCGEQLLAFLCIDHIHNNAAVMRREQGRQDGPALWKYLKKQGWPSGFQVLCYNCNNGKRVNNGVCPHQEGKQ